MLTGVNPSHDLSRSIGKGFSPSGKITLEIRGYVKFICIFELFQQLTTSVRCCLCRAHTFNIRNIMSRRGKGGIDCGYFYVTNKAKRFNANKNINDE